MSFRVVSLQQHTCLASFFSTVTFCFTLFFLAFTFSSPYLSAFILQPSAQHQLAFKMLSLSETHRSRTTTQPIRFSHQWLLLATAEELINSRASMPTVVSVGGKEKYYTFGEASQLSLPFVDKSRAPALPKIPNGDRIALILREMTLRDSYLVTIPEIDTFQHETVQLLQEVWLFCATEEKCTFISGTNLIAPLPLGRFLMLLNATFCATLRFGPLGNSLRSF